MKKVLIAFVVLCNGAFVYPDKYICERIFNGYSWQWNRGNLSVPC